MVGKTGLQSSFYGTLDQTIAEKNKKIKERVARK